MTKSKKNKEPIPPIPAEFGGIFGALGFTVLIPFGVIYSLICADRCANFYNSKLTSINNWFQTKAVILYSLFVLITFLQMLIPIGGEIVYVRRPHGQSLMNFNGLFSLLACMFSCLLLEYLRFNLFNYMIENIFQLAISCILFGFILTFFVHIRSMFKPTSIVNERSVGQHAICQFYLGKEVHPSICNVDLKYFVLRLSLIGALVFDLAYVYKNVACETGLNWTLLVHSLFHAIYLTDTFLFEKVWLTSFEMEHEGFGYMDAAGYPIYAFIIACQTKYIAECGVQLPVWALALTSVQFLIGYTFFRGANNQKNTFRTDPHNPQVKNLKTLKTAQGNRLLISGYWGFSRHPNYFGDILLTLASAPYLYNTPILLLCAMPPLLLLHRTFRTDEKCRIKYGNDWEKYCSIVKYKVLPGVF